MRLDGAAVARAVEKTPMSFSQEGGFVLLDQSLEPVALDPGASAIFRYPAQPGSKPEPALEEILTLIRLRKPSERSSMMTRLRVGDGKYVCRVYLLQPEQQFSKEPLLGLHLEPDLSAGDPVVAVAADYRLTEREQEALRGISMGFSSKELAVRMKISPNTVKVFLRMIMIKMGVTTRSGVIAKVLEYYGGSPVPIATNASGNERQYSRGADYRMPHLGQGRNTD